MPNCSEKRSAYLMARLTALFELFRDKEPSEAFMQAYLKALEPYPIEKVENAIDFLQEHSRFLPKIVEFLEYLEGGSVTDEVSDKAELAWSAIRQLFDNFINENDQILLPSSVMAEALKRIGGLPLLVAGKVQSEHVIGYKKSFIAAYKKALKDGYLDKPCSIGPYKAHEQGPFRRFCPELWTEGLMLEHRKAISDFYSNSDFEKLLSRVKEDAGILPISTPLLEGKANELKNEVDITFFEAEFEELELEKPSLAAKARENKDELMKEMLDKQALLEPSKKPHGD